MSEQRAALQGNFFDEIYCFDKLDNGMFPLTYQIIYKYHCKDKELAEKRNITPN